jgi:hypothetical protein
MNNLQTLLINNNAIQIIVSRRSEKSFTIQYYRAQNIASIIKNKTRITWP